MPWLVWARTAAPLELPLARVGSTRYATTSAEEDGRRRIIAGPGREGLAWSPTERCTIGNSTKRSMGRSSSGISFHLSWSLSLHLSASQHHFSEFLICGSDEQEKSAASRNLPKP